MIAGCGSSSSEIGSGALVMASYQPYTGPDAAYGPEGTALCSFAAYEINSGGGVMGHKFQCEAFDSTGDPADALPVANRMLANTTNLIMVYGPTQSAQRAVEPVLNQEKIVHFPDSGDPAYDHQTSPYFIRNGPSDSLAGTAIAAYTANHAGYKHVAIAFTNEEAAQTVVPALKETFAKLGGTFTSEQTLAPGQTSYRTEISHILASHPEAIVTEMDPQTAATFFSEELELNGGELLPTITTSAALDSNWVGGVAKAIGPEQFMQKIVAVASNTPTEGPGYEEYLQALKKAPNNIPERENYAADPYAQLGYDGLVCGALAMLEANSLESEKWAPYVPKVINGEKGAIVVHTFPEGKKAIEAGKTVRWSGAAGLVTLNKYNNSSTPFTGYKWNGKGNGVASLEPTGGEVSSKELEEAGGA
ncbi:MAG: ABC transporter substrate-binding protein [Actinobacteria bacterium]|nr:ABC transporter substrate-binding protein [Actinomycetota bacterium]